MVINWGTDYFNQFFVIFESNEANNILNDELIIIVFTNLNLAFANTLWLNSVKLTEFSFTLAPLYKN